MHIPPPKDLYKITVQLFQFAEIQKIALILQVDDVHSEKTILLCNQERHRFPSNQNIQGSVFPSESSDVRAEMRMHETNEKVLSIAIRLHFRKEH